MDVVYTSLMRLIFCPLGSLLSVLRTSWCPVRLNPELQWFLHRAGWQQHGSGVPETTQWDHRRLWRGGTVTFSFFFFPPLEIGNRNRPLGDLLHCVFIWMYVLQLMDKGCYKDIEKIKTIGSTYMAAVGLVPTIGTKVACHFVFLCVFVLACRNGCRALKLRQICRINSCIDTNCVFPSLGQKVCLWPSEHNSGLRHWDVWCFGWNQLSVVQRVCLTSRCVYPFAELST